ncbi:MAG: YggT family protein [Anaerolineales bacterium]
MALIIELIGVVFTLLWLVVLADVLVSWVMSPYHEVRRFLDSVVQPLLDPIRRLVPPVGGLDLSPLVLLLALDLVRRLLVGLLVSFG